MGRDFNGSSFMATRAPLDFRQHLEVETPEHVVLDYEIAGLGSRALAAIIDTLILIGWSMALLVVFALLSFQFEDWAGAIFTLVMARLAAYRRRVSSSTCAVCSSRRRF